MLLAFRGHWPSFGQSSPQKDERVQSDTNAIAHGIVKLISSLESTRKRARKITHYLYMAWHDRSKQQKVFVTHTTANEHSLTNKSSIAPEESTHRDESQFEATEEHPLTDASSPIYDESPTPQCNNSKPSGDPPTQYDPNILAIPAELKVIVIADPPTPANEIHLPCGPARFSTTRQDTSDTRSHTPTSPSASPGT